ncbi:MAG: oligosaccharide flippase family protein [Methylococcales bacterium]|nr:oligosaccharide flippase family protein [Methylococcales bacterium]
MIQNHPLDLYPNNFRSVLMFVFALANYALMYAANILLARSLTVDDFDDYSVALSIVTMLSTLATLGLEKYALRAIALFRERQDWPRFRGFWLFSLRTISGFSLLLVALLSIGLETMLAIHHADYHIAIVVFAGFLPIIALTLFLVEVIAAHGAHLLSMAIYRLFLPLVYMTFLIGLSFSSLELSALSAVLCFGFAWVLTLIVIWFIAKMLMPVEVKQSIPLRHRKKWLIRSSPLVLSSLMMTVITSSGVVILELLFPSGIEVGTYAIAAQTGSFISLIGTSTNRYYLSTMVVMIDRHDKQSIQRLMNQRTRVVGGLILILMAILVFSGQKILSLFGTHFSAGYNTVLIIATGASVSALFADIPYYLQFMGFHRAVLSLTMLAMLSMVALGFLLGAEYGTVGVAFAYMIPVVLLFIVLRIMAMLRFRRF